MGEECLADERCSRMVLVGGCIGAAVGGLELDTACGRRVEAGGGLEPPCGRREEVGERLRVLRFTGAVVLRFWNPEGGAKRVGEVHNPFIESPVLTEANNLHLHNFMN